MPKNLDFRFNRILSVIERWAACGQIDLDNVSSSQDLRTLRGQAISHVRIVRAVRVVAKPSAGSFGEEADVDIEVRNKVVVSRPGRSKKMLRVIVSLLG